jgi:hypothetical protein
VADDVIAFGQNQMIFITERCRKATHKIEQAIAAGRDVGAVLDIAFRPEALRRGVVAFVALIRFCGGFSKVMTATKPSLCKLTSDIS